MKICIIGMNLTSLILAKAMINNGFTVDVIASTQKKRNLSTRTIGVSKSNIDFINNHIINIKPKQFHNIKKIRILSEKKRELINFYNKGENLFSLIEVDKFFKIIFESLKFNKLFKLKKFNNQNFKINTLKDDYNLIINCEKNNFISKKYFSKKIQKSYNSTAYTSLLYHKTIKNNEAKQYFTNLGPLAFLPISPKITSVVLSAYKNKKLNPDKFKNFVNNFKDNLNVVKFSELQLTELNFSIPRNYYQDNILLFGDGLHQIHPLAGQGFNMTLRDLKIFLNIIKNKIENGLEVNAFCLKEFEKLTKSKNFIFSEGINIIQDIFRLKNIFGENKVNNMIEKFGKNKILKSFFIKTADEGIFVF